MNVQDVINSGVNQLVAALTKNLGPAEAAAIGQIIEGVVALIEAQAVKRGLPALLAEMAKKYPLLAPVLAEIPELQSLLHAA